MQDGATTRRRFFLNKRSISLLLAALCLLAACNDTSTVVYPSDPAVWAGCPIIPSPAPWFKWSQLYIYDTYTDGAATGQAYMDGYGGIHDDYTDTKTGLVYGANAWLSALDPETVDSLTYVRLEDTVAEFDADPVGLAWRGKGMSSLMLDGELLIFDYPLVLGKTWTSTTTAYGFVPVRIEAAVVAYVPAGITSSDDIRVAPGYTYTLPVDIADIPQPLAELGDLSFADLDAAGDAEAQLPWSAVLIPAGPRAGQNVTGYYVVQTQTKLMGITIMQQELWKDVRGYVPLYDIYKYPPLVKAATHITRLARRWTGTAAMAK